MQSKELAFWKRASHSHSAESRVWGIFSLSVHPERLEARAVPQAAVELSTLERQGQSFQHLTDLAEMKPSRNKDRAKVQMSCGGQEEEGL